MIRMGAWRFPLLLPPPASSPAPPPASSPAPPPALSPAPLPTSSPASPQSFLSRLVMCQALAGVLFKRKVHYNPSYILDAWYVRNLQCRQFIGHTRGIHIVCMVCTGT